MKQAEFLNLYREVRALPNDAMALHRTNNKDKLCEIIVNCLNALVCAENCISRQADVITQANTELVQKFRETRCDHQQNNLLPRKSGFDKKPPPIVLKPIDDANSVDQQSLSDELRSALKNIQVSNTNFTSTGSVYVNLPNNENHEAALNSLSSAFSGSFTVQKAKEITPQILIANVPAHVNKDNIIHLMREKNKCLSELCEQGEFLQFENSWRPKHVSDNNAPYTFVLKCSKIIRNYIVEACNGYIYIDLARCKVYDYVSSLQCYHCYKFNHKSSSCPDRTKSSVCGICANLHETRNCANRNNIKCINCVRAKRNDHNHVARSSKCQSFIDAKNAILSKIDFSSISNRNENVSPGSDSKNR